MNRIGIVVPTYNPGPLWSQWLEKMRSQSLMPSVRLIVDSSSSDGSLGETTLDLFDVQIIAKNEFNHGGTRQRAAMKIAEQVDIVIFMTQDALLHDEHSLRNLVQIFDDNPDVAAAYGRQFPHVGSHPSEAHARLFNYKEKNILKSLNSKFQLGFKSIFISNSFAAYRVKDLMDVGGFPTNVILGEDTIVAAKFLLAGKIVAYQADAAVYHSHHYSYGQEFKRYFDIGVLHAREPWLLKEFGQVDGEGMRYLRSEIRFLKRDAWYLIPSCLIRTGFKFLGYKIGRHEQRLPTRLKKMFSMYKGYWLSNN